MPDEFSDSELSGPKIDRRTVMKMVGGAGASLSAATAGCLGGGGDEKKKGKGGGKITAAWHIDEILDLDPVVNSTGQFEQVSMNLYAALLRTTPKFEIRGDLAKDWTVKNQAKTFEFTLRKGAKFQGDYGEITAKDVQDVVYRGLNEQGSTSKPKLSKIKKPVRGTGVKKLGKYKVQINLKGSFAPFIKAMTKAGGACNIHPVKAVEKMGRQKFKTNPVGSGPFKVKEHKVGQRIVLKPHGGYYRKDDDGNQLPYLDEVEVKTMPDSTTMLNALKAGDAQFANQIPTQNLKQIKKSPKSKAMKAPAAGWIALYLNPKKKVFDSPKKRRGIAKIFDSKQFVKDTFFGNQMPAIGPIGPAHGPFYRKYENKPDYQKYEPKKGEKLIEETGIKDMDVTIHTQSEDMRRARGYKKQLDSHFNVEIKPVDTSTYLDLLDGIHPDTKHKGYFSAGWGSDIDIAVDTTMYFFFKHPEKGGAFNDMLYKDDDVDKWLEQQRKATSTQKRVKLMQKVEDRVMKEAPCIFTHHVVPWQAIGSNVKGYKAHPFRRDFENITLKK